ncbi:N-acetylmuramoyl-L-alanine amidase family protein [Xiamenia xianingshaonis]|uniref:N-acetylmuramoyl-L-alanine amidase family protein n=1 Tax=Xiamenia xianingshaonis TaxID=2682776 RepID=A0A9E6MQQ5_9ACTN|nr:N-acetylmuramoyl-L-alanine amidase family protein [Xiamenia xianingshaonis]NHM14152.1 hypothetical protein [Xiamenia xianingshaonis]QTU84230.1 N-acetylmuramoyl-L-alanine amidase family protein [Xiamenia xianingshaonis]
MTPAAALSQAALEATPAYAGTTTDDTAEEPAPVINAWTDGEGATPAVAEYVDAIGKTGAKLVLSIVDPAPVTYNALSREYKDIKVKIAVSYTENEKPVTEYFTLSSDLYTLDFVSSVDSTDATVANNVVTVNNANPDGYAIKAVVKDGGPKVKNDGTYYPGGTQLLATKADGNGSIIVNKAPITKDAIKVATGYVGASTPADVAKATKAELSLKGNTTGMINLLDETNPVIAVECKDTTAGTPGKKLTDSKNVFIETGTVPVEVKLVNATAKKNYTLEGALTGGATDTTNGTLTLSANIVQASNYQARFVSGAGVTGTVVPSNNGASGVAPWVADDPDAKPSVSLAENIKNSIQVYIPAATEGGAVTDVPAGWGVTYTDAEGNPLVDPEDGKTAVTPTAPGKYRAVVAMDGNANPIATLDVTVQANITPDVDFKFNGQDLGSDLSGSVKLAWKAGLTDAERSADVVAQIKAGLKGTLLEGTETLVNLDDLAITDSTPLNTVDGAGQVTVTPSGNGLYKGIATINYGYGEDLPKFSLKKASQPYAGSGAADGYVVKSLLNIPQVESEDTPGTTEDLSDEFYKVTVTDAKGKVVADAGTERLTEAGKYTITVSGTDGYVGTQSFPFEITQLGMTADNVSWVGNTYDVVYDATKKVWATPYNGTVLEPVPTISAKFESGTFNDFKQKPKEPAKGETWDYEISWANNKNKGTATATLVFTGNYSGTVEIPFEITPVQLTLNNASAEAQSQLAAGFPENPTAADVLNPVVTYTPGKGDPVELTEDDYAIGKVTKGATASNGVTEYSFVVEGKGNYTGSITGTFKTVNQDIAKLATAEVDKDQTLIYDYGAPVPATVTVTPNSGELVENEDYKIVCSENTDAGTATVEVVGIGNYAGSIPLTYEIAPVQINDASNVEGKSIKLDGADDLVYNGEEQAPEVLVNGSTFKPANKELANKEPELLSKIYDDLSIAVKEGTGVNAGTSYIVLSPRNGNLTGSIEIPYKIAPAELTADNVAVAASVAPGASAADAVSVTFGEAALVAGTDYTVAVAEGATVPGKVKATVTGAGNYAGTVEKESAVLYDVAKADVSVAGAVYNGKAQDPKVEVSYTSGGKKVVVDPKAYDVKVDGNATDAGSYKVTVTGKASEGWTNSAEKSFVIAPATVTAKPQVSYDAAGLPVVTVPGLTSNDFTYKPDAATKTITVTYKGNYAGTATVAYVPTAKPVAPAQPAAGKTGWVGSGNDWAYYKDGKQVKDGWEWIDNAWYHFEANGKMTNTQWFQDADGEWYLLNQSHKGSYGAMLTGWQKVDGGWYYMGASGDMQSGWLKDGGEWYLLNTAHDGTFGKMLTGWQQVGGKWYYMDASGAMASNAWVGRYWVNGSGVWTATR